MKKFTLAFLPLLMLAACSKDNQFQDEDISAAQSPGTYISEWETGYSWSRSDSADFQVFSYVKNLPQLQEDILERGAVVVALKNVPYKPDSLLTSPQLVPFSVIPYYGNDQQKPIYDQHWYIIPQEGQLTLKYRSNRHLFFNEPVIPPDGRVSARYFLLTAEDLARIGQTRESILHLTYEELVAALGIFGR